MPGEGFKQAGELVAGDQILLLDGSIKTIDKVTAEALETPVAVYNFTVEDWHTYFVGEQRVLVHNTKRCPKTTDAKNMNVKRMKVGSSGHLAERIYVGPRQGDFIGNDDELFDAYRKAYSSLGDMIVDVESPNGKNILGTDVTLVEAMDLIQNWLKEQGLY